MLIKASFFFVCVFSFAFLSSENLGKSEASPNAKTLDFWCEHHCGEWGSESIRKIEWEFIQCLYDANLIAAFIDKNFWASVRNWDFFEQPPLEPMFYLRPTDFDSRWYKKMLDKGHRGGFVISNAYNCWGDWGVRWRISHVDDSVGNHIGKHFSRVRYKDFEDAYDENGAFCLWTNPVEETTYSFTNIIDFHNTCSQLALDLLDEVKDNTYRTIDDHPIFRKEMYDRYARLSTQLIRTQGSYCHIFRDCARLHRAPSALYNLAIHEFLEGKYEEAIESLGKLLEKVDPECLEANLASNICETRGKLEVEVALYDEAITSLTRAIALNPEKKEAYFERASAYFESGQFDLAINDYLENWKGNSSFSDRGDWDVMDFGTGIIVGAKSGIEYSGSNFFPSIYSSLQGMGNLLWTTVQHPIEAPKQFAKSVMDFFGYLRTCNKAELAEMVVPEIYELVVNWDALRPQKRGELAGHALGKYGTEILLAYATYYGATLVKTYGLIRHAEKLCTLETLTHSKKSKKELLQASARWQEQRRLGFSKVQLEVDKQAKHIPGSKNYQKDGVRGIWTHPDPQKLLREHAGKGQKVVGVAGEAGYRERVNFGEIIGEFVKENTGEKIPTTVGIIHYSKKGAHIVPAKPQK